MQRGWHLRAGNRNKAALRKRRGACRIEWLEPRWLLAAPELAPLADVTVLAGAPSYVALDGFDADGDSLAFTATVSNAQLNNSADPNASLDALISGNNRSLKLSVQGFGDMVFELFENWAPQTTGRIIELAESGFYDGLTFHRIIENFVIQGGDPNGNGTGGSGTTFDDEYHPLLQHTSAGVLSMAKSADDTNDSQFFITADAIRSLDFNHSVFGFLVEGETVRQAIAAVDTDASDRPLNPVVIDSADVFLDEENGALVLYAPEGTTGEADVTVTVTDSEGNTVERSFHVTVEPDPVDNNAYLRPIAPVETGNDTPISFVIPAVSIEDDPVEYFAQLITPTDDVTVSVNQLTGAVTVVPANGVSGVFQIQVAVRDPDAFTVDPWDSQFVPVYVDPPPPELVELLAASDTGTSQSDGLTNLDNTPGNTLRFRVSGVLDGAEVWLLADGVDLGHVTASGDTVEIETTAGFPLSDGPHSITAVQVLRDQQVNVGNLHDTVDLFSPDSTPLAITVDTDPPVFTSQPIVEGAEGRLYQYDAEVAAEAADQVVYELVQAPAGMSLVDPLAGKIVWTPGHDQSGLHDVVLRVMDAAGNEAEQQFQIDVTDAPELDPIGPQQVIEGQTLSFTATAQGDEGPLRFELGADAPEGATIDSQTGHFTWTPSEAQGPGEYQVTVRVVNTLGAAASETVPITVAEQNQPPELAAVDDVLVNEGELVELALQALDADLPEQQLTFELVGQVPNGMTLDAQTGLLQWQTGEVHGPGQYAITVRVTDPYGASSETGFTIQVAEVDQAPRVDALPDRLVRTGGRLELSVRATDPDLPARNIRYSLDAAPAGMDIDPQSGRLTWDVPAGFVGPGALQRSFTAVVRATEIAPDGSPGLSTTADLKVQVVEVRALAAAALARQAGTIDALLQAGGNAGGNTGGALRLLATWPQRATPPTPGVAGGITPGMSETRDAFSGTVQLDRFGSITRPTAGFSSESQQQPLSTGSGGTRGEGQRSGRQAPANSREGARKVRPASRDSSRSDPAVPQSGQSPEEEGSPVIRPEAADAVIAWLADSAATNSHRAEPLPGNHRPETSGHQPAQSETPNGEDTTPPSATDG